MAALPLWGCEWNILVGMPSRLAAEPSHRQSRAAMLKQALEQESTEGYEGVRVGRRGRRFQIEAARIWLLKHQTGTPFGQAAAFEAWRRWLVGQVLSDPQNSRF